MKFFAFLSVAFLWLGSCGACTAPSSSVVSSKRSSLLQRQPYPGSTTRRHPSPSLLLQRLLRLHPPPPPPSPPSPLSKHNRFHVIPINSNAHASTYPNPDDQPVSVDDGIPLQEKVPRAIIRVSALLGEKLTKSGADPFVDFAANAMTERLSRRLRDAASGLSDTDARAYCTTDECVQMMKEYDEWRRRNGYGTVAGRWG